MKSKTVHRLQSRVRSQLIMLAAQFLLGMAVNLIGFPSETTGFAQTATATFTGLHVLVAVGLVVGATITLVQIKKHMPSFTTLGWWGLGAIIVTFVSGSFTMAYENNWWSYAMAIGFFVSTWIYGVLYFRVAEPSGEV